MIDPKPVWDFDDPAGSEARLRRAADDAGTAAERAAWLTQVARALGLQERFDEGHAVLDGLDGLEAADDEVAVRSKLERGRLFRSGGDPGAARPLFEEAAALASRTGLEELHVDALHMVAIVAPAEDQLRLNEEALAVARSSSAPAARNWDASLLNNIGMVHAEAGDHATALERFQEALAARERIGDVDRTRVATWMVAWSLRELGRTEEALRMQRALKAQLDADGKTDPYVDQELDILEGRTPAPA